MEMEPQTNFGARDFYQRGIAGDSFVGTRVEDFHFDPIPPGQRVR